MPDPTERQLDVLRAIAQLANEQGYPASYEQLGERLELCKARIYQHVTELAVRGLVRRERYGARTLRLTDAAKAWVP